MRSASITVFVTHAPGRVLPWVLRKVLRTSEDLGKGWGMYSKHCYPLVVLANFVMQGASMSLQDLHICPLPRVALANGVPINRNAKPFHSPMKPTIRQW